MYRMGFNVELDDEGNFKFSGSATNPSAQQVQDGKGDYPGQPSDNKVVTQDHDDGLSAGQKMQGNTPRGSKSSNL
jgi:hypothetical protein